MKSGVFRSGDFVVYVTSDQRITAHTDLRLLSDVHPSPDYKVSYNKAGDTVSRNGLTYTRIEGDFGYKAEAAVAAARRQIEVAALGGNRVIAENNMRPGVFQNDNMLIYVASNMWMRACCRIGVGCVYSGAGQPVTYDTDHDTVSRNGLSFSRVKGNFGDHPVLAVERAAERMRGQVLNGKRATHAVVDELQRNADAKPVGQVVNVNVNHVTFTLSKGTSVVNVDALLNHSDTKPVNQFFGYYGTCGKQSARKHRKLGHKVTKISNNRYTWSK